MDTIVFDKTGTVTEGRFAIAAIISLDRSEDDLLSLAAAAEQSSDHALSRVIVGECRRRGLVLPECAEAGVLPGRGVQCIVGGRTVRAGSALFLAENGIFETEAVEQEADRRGATAVFVAEGHRLAGAILLRDCIREGIREAVGRLRSMGIGNQVILTGDRRRPAEVIAAELGIGSVEAELLPEQKLDRIRALAAQGNSVAMAGDGINDAPALAAASVGIAVAGASDIAAEAAGVVYLPHSLDRLPQLFEVSRRAMRTAWLNIVLFAGLVNLLAVIACATGRLGPLGAALTHQLASFCVMMNSLRLLRVESTSPWRWRPMLPELNTRLLRPAVAAVAAVLVLSGFYAIQPDELGIIERFGRNVMPSSAPGLHYKLPWPVERLTRICARRIRVVEIGFRTNPAASFTEPASYEWNVPHRTGRFESRPSEALTLTGEQNMIELNATVHYDIEHPGDFLFRQLDGEATVRAAAESVIHGVASTMPLDSLLTTGRQLLENRAQREIQRRMEKYESGIRILRVQLEAVHPSTEVVDAFRDVSAAFEEKNRVVNEAEGYRNEQIALARGSAKAGAENAKQYALGRINRSDGDASRFVQQEQSFRTAPGPTRTRLYLETMEQVLPARRKLIVDSSHSRRHLLLVEDGVELAPSVAAANRD